MLELYSFPAESTKKTIGISLKIQLIGYQIIMGDAAAPNEFARASFFVDDRGCITGANNKAITIIFYQILWNFANGFAWFR